VHHAPGKYALVEFGRGKRPSPGTHDHERSDAVGIRECKTKTGRATPIVADHGRVPDVELPQQACQICDWPSRLCACSRTGFLGQAKPDHVWNNDPPARSRQRLYEFPIQESPGGIAMQENDGIAGTSSM